MRDVPVFDYTAIAPDGRQVAGRIDAPDRRAAAQRLQRAGSLPVELREQGAATGAGPGRAAGDRRLGARDLARLTRGLALLTGAGLPLDTALDTLAASEAGAAPRTVLRAVQEAVRAGGTLSAAAAARPLAFPAWWAASVGAAEGTGRLPQVLDGVAAELLRAERLGARLRAALTYPALVGVLALVVLGVLSGVVLPALEPLLRASGAELPWSTELLLDGAAWLGAQGPALLAATLLALLLLRRAMAKPAARRARDAWLLGLPALGPLLRAAATARALRPLALLLRAGVALPEALGHAAASAGNAALAEALQRVRDGVSEGGRLGPALAREAVVPPLAATLAATGEEGGRLREMLEEAAAIHEEIAERASERLLALLAPGATLVLGGLVALVVLATLDALLGANAAAVGGR
jgi:general secretion pathway protein F